MIDNLQSRDTAAVSTPRKFTGVMLGLVQTHRVAILGALLASFLFLSGWLLFRRVPHVPAIVGEWAREAQDTAASWPVAPINTAIGREEASRFLASRLPVEATGSYPENVLESGAAFIVEFLAAKQLETFDEYITWAQSQDYRIRDQWPVNPRFKEDVFQESYRRSLNIQDENIRCTPTEFFRDIYKHNHAASDGAFVPVGLAAGENAAHIQIATFTHHADTFDYQDDLTARPPGVRFWVGGVGWSWLRFTEPPNTLKELIERHGEATVMRVLLLTVGPTGLKMPTDIYQFYDPDHKQWSVYQVMQNNFILSAGLGPKEDTWDVY